MVFAILRQRINVIRNHLHPTIHVNEILEIVVETDARPQYRKRDHKTADQQCQRQFLVSVQPYAGPRHPGEHRQEQSRKDDPVRNTTEHPFLNPFHRMVIEDINAVPFFLLGPVDVDRLEVVEDVLDGLLHLVKGGVPIVGRGAALVAETPREECQQPKGHRENPSQIRVAIEQVPDCDNDAEHVIEQERFGTVEQHVQVGREFDEFGRDVPQVEFGVVLGMTVNDDIDHVPSHKGFELRHQFGINVREDRVQDLEHYENTHYDTEQHCCFVELGGAQAFEEFAVHMGDGDPFNGEETYDDDVDDEGGEVVLDEGFVEGEHCIGVSRRARSQEMSKIKSVGEKRLSLNRGGSTYKIGVSYGPIRSFQHRLPPQLKQPFFSSLIHCIIHYKVVTNRRGNLYRQECVRSAFALTMHHPFIQCMVHSFLEQSKEPQ